MQRNHEGPGTWVVRRRLPVMPTQQARTRGDATAHTGITNVLPIFETSGCPVDGLEDVLIDRLPQVDECTSAPVKFPQNPVFSDREQPLFSVRVDQDTFIDNIEIKRFTGHMLEIPFDLPRLWV